MYYRSIWLSDIHLGTNGCKADILLDFLRHNESDTLYLVGDIIDGWRLRNKFFWPQSHNDIIQKVLRKARKGTKVIYVPGNHDEFLKEYTNHFFGMVEIVNEYIHTTVDGKKLLIIHGDQFDGITTQYKRLALLGDWAYDLMLDLNIVFNWFRRKFGLGYWSLSAYLKNKVKTAVNFIGDYEKAISNECKKRGFNGIVAGHIHKAEIRNFHEITYFNDGDWVESCTAMVELYDGTIQILHHLENGESKVIINRDIDGNIFRIE